MTFTRPHLVSLSAALALAACASTPKQVARPAVVQPISNQAQMSDVIAWLNAGDAKAASATLEVMLKRDPADASAAILRDTIARDPVELLGVESFDYEVRAGDTMVLLSQRFLGSSLKFYALARYNGIVVPSTLPAGRTLRIPGEAPKQAATPRETKQGKPRIAEAAQPQSKTEAAAKPATPVVNPRRAAALRSAGLGALAKGQVDRSVGLLRQASVLDPGNALIRRDLDRAQRVRATVTAKR